MNKLLTGTVLAIATLAAAPAFAATHHRANTAAYSANAAASDAEYTAATRDPDVVIDHGQYIGRDPDPFIRSQLLRDANGSQGD